MKNLVLLKGFHEPFGKNKARLLSLHFDQNQSISTAECKNNLRFLQYLLLSSKKLKM